MRFRGRPLVFLGAAALSWSSAAQPAPELRSAASFAILANSSVTSATPSRVAGNVGVSPGGTVSGVSLSLGAIYKNDALAKAAQKDNAAVYDELRSRSCTAPRVQCIDGDYRLSGPLVLDAGGDANAFWIFNINGALSVDPEASVIVINGGYDGNVFWRVGTTATLGEDSAFKGNILALRDITVRHGVKFSGRALTQNGAMTLDDSDVSICCAPISVAPAMLPDGIVGTAYSETLAASGGTESFRFSATGLPDWLHLNGNVLSGSPVPGTYTFLVTATDTMTGCTGGRMYTIIVCPVVHFPATLPAGVAGKRYEQTFDGPYVFSVTPPPDWPLRFEGNVLTGVPSAEGDYTFVVRAGCTEHTYTVHVRCPTVTIDNASLPDGVVGVVYREPIIVSDEDVPTTLRATAEPNDWVLSFEGKTLTGTPPRPIPYMVTIAASTNGTSCPAISRTYPVDVRQSCEPITIATETLPPGIVGTEYHATIDANGMTTTPGPLPPGVDLSTGRVFSGTPEAPGRYCFTVTVTNACGAKATRDYCIDVTCPPIAFSPAALPSGKAGKPYDRTITITGAKTISVTPATQNGLTATHDATSVRITGTPVAPGSVTFTITASVYACSEVRDYTILVTPPPTGNGVPTLSEWALLVLLALLIAIAIGRLQ